jgi:hypothetical protein
MVKKFDEWDPFGEESSDDDQEFERWLDKYYYSVEGLYAEGDHLPQILYCHKGSGSSGRKIFQTRERLHKSFKDSKKIIGG